MNRHFFNGAFLLGALALAWVGAGFFGSHGLALLMTALIAAVYGVGAFELHRFRQATAALSTALKAIPEGLGDLSRWLATVPAALQNPVRLRIEGERTGLPGPALTPYLVGLLVMLGMLGTFLGMVVTLNGAVFALEGTTDLAAIRSAFSAPIKGLGLAFGTSVAGVASSAMLGLMSAVARRERMLAAQLLDTQIATVLRVFSLTHQRQETLRALQAQSLAMPAVVDTLQTMMAQMASLNRQMNERVLSNQASFHGEVKTVYTDLAHSVDLSLRNSLSQFAQVAGQSIQPVVEAAMSGVAQEATLMHQRMMTATQTQMEDLLLAVHQAYRALRTDQTTQDGQQLDAWKGALQTMASGLTQEWQHTGEKAQLGVAQTLAEITRLMTRTEELIRSRMASDADLSRQHGERMSQLATSMRSELGALREEEALRGNAAVQRLDELQTAVTGHLTTLGTALEDPIKRLLQTASEAPRAAAEVIGKLRQEVASSAARDNELLEERSRIMATLNSLLDSIHHASVEQRGVIDSLVSSSAAALHDASSQFAQRVDVQADKLADIAADVTSSAVEVSALGETFGFAVRSFREGNEKLITSLQRIEGAMDKSMTRSDEQLAYYVAQAREVIDLSVMSQKEIFEELRQLPGRHAAMGEEVA